MNDKRETRPVTERHSSALVPEDAGPMRSPEEVKRAREKRKRQAIVEQLREEVEIAEGFRRVRNTVLIIVAILAVIWGIWEINQRWGTNWPILLTWFVISGVIIVGFGWALWYLDKGD